MISSRRNLLLVWLPEIVVDRLIVIPSEIILVLDHLSELQNNSSDFSLDRSTILLPPQYSSRLA